MPKSAFLLPILIAFFAIAGWLHPIDASTNTSSCLSALASTPLCDEILTQSCIQGAKEEITPEAEPFIIISSPQDSQAPQTFQTQPVASTASTSVGEITPPTDPVESAPVEAPTIPVVLDLNSDKIFELVNQYRASLGLPAFEREASVCDLAQVRSSKLAGELANGTIHSGLYSRNLPYWIWENAKVGSNEEETIAWWISSPLHRQSIVSDYKYSCVKCTGSNCSQLFTSFTPK